MDYKKVLAECKARAEAYRVSGAVWNLTHEENCIAAITDLLARAEAAEKGWEKALEERERLQEMIADAEDRFHAEHRTNKILRKMCDDMEAREEKKDAVH